MPSKGRLNLRKIKGGRGGEREEKGREGEGLWESEFTLLLLGRGIKYGGPPTSTKVCEPQIPVVKTNRTLNTHTYTHITQQQTPHSNKHHMATNIT